MEIYFIPIEVVQVWRVIVWVVSLMLLGSIAAFMPRAWRERESLEFMTRWSLDLYIAVATFVFQGCITQVVRWDRPLMLEGLPLTTIAVGWCASARVRRARAS